MFFGSLLSCTNHRVMWRIREGYSHSDQSFSTIRSMQRYRDCLNFSWLKIHLGDAMRKDKTFWKCRFWIYWSYWHKSQGRTIIMCKPIFLRVENALCDSAYLRSLVQSNKCFESKHKDTTSKTFLICNAGRCECSPTIFHAKPSKVFFRFLNKMLLPGLQIIFCKKRTA